jgi:transcriptional regulator
VYVPKHFAPASIEWAHDFIAQVRVGTLVTSGGAGLNAALLPLAFDRGSMTLRGVIERANVQDCPCDALVIYQGVDAYISPTFFPSKGAHQRVVPTWHYEVVHVYGRARFVDDAPWPHTTRAGLAAGDVLHDPFAEGVAQPVGFEIAIARIEGKRKLGQDEPEADRWGAVAGLKMRNNDRGSHAIAELMMAQEQ